MELCSHVPTARVLSNWEEEGREPGFSSKPGLGRSKADFPAEKATILTEGWLKRVSTEPLPETEFEGGRDGAGWKEVGTVECRRGAGKGMLSPGGRSWSMIMGSVMARKAVEVSKVLSDNHVYSRRGTIVVDIARRAGAWRGWTSSNYETQILVADWGRISSSRKHLRHESNDVCELTLRMTALTKPELQRDEALVKLKGQRVCPMARDEDWMKVEGEGNVRPGR